MNRVALNIIVTNFFLKNKLKQKKKKGFKKLGSSGTPVDFQTGKMEIQRGEVGAKKRGNKGAKRAKSGKWIVS